MTKNPIYLTREDHARLRLLLAIQPAARNRFAQLQEELARAMLVEADRLPPDVVRLGSHVEILDLDTGEVSAYTLTLPEQANAAEARLSVLAPIGTAVLGYAEGDEIVWETPGGLRRMQLRRVEPPVTALPLASSDSRHVPPSLRQSIESKAS